MQLQTVLDQRARLLSWELGAVGLGGGFLVGQTVTHEGLASPKIFALVALAGATVLLSLRPDVVLLFWLFVAPIFQSPADATSLGHPLTLALYVVPPVAFVLWTMTRRTPLRPALVDVIPAAYVLYLFGSLVVTTSLLAEDPFKTLKAFYVTFAIGVVLYYFVAFAPIGWLAPERLLRVFFWSALFVFVLAFADSFAHWTLWPTPPQIGIYRATASFSSPGILGGFIGIATIMATSVLVWRGPGKFRSLAAVVLLAGLPALFLTYTRGAIVSSVVGLAIVGLSRFQSRFVTAAMIVLAAAAIFATWGRISSSHVYKDRVNDRVNVQGRELIARWSIKLAEERPFFGWGYSSFDKVKNEAAAKFGSGAIPLRYGTSYTSHNTFLTIAVNYGLVGLLLFAAPFLVIGWRGIKLARERPEVRWLVVGGLAAIVAWALNANTMDMRFFSYVPALPWLLLGLIRRYQIVPAAIARETV